MNVTQVLSFLPRVFGAKTRVITNRNRRRKEGKGNHTGVLVTCVVVASSWASSSEGGETAQDFQLSISVWLFPDWVDTWTNVSGQESDVSGISIMVRMDRILDRDVRGLLETIRNISCNTRPHSCKSQREGESCLSIQPPLLRLTGNVTIKNVEANGERCISAAFLGTVQSPPRRAGPLLCVHLLVRTHTREINQEMHT